jgi:cytidylate kinase
VEGAAAVHDVESPARGPAARRILDQPGRPCWNGFMTRHTPTELSSIAPLADRQMKRWAMHLQSEQRLALERALERFPADVHPYVAISREAGAGGGDVGRLVAARLGYECLDNQLLTYMAEHYGLPEGLLDLVDERTSSWLHDIFRLWLDRRAVTHDQYVMNLGQVATLAARNASAVFVGRGIQFLLPRDRGLAVRVVAPLAQRLARTMERRTLGREEAARSVRETDEGRAFLIRRHFNADVADPHLYDLVVNLEHLDLEVAADLIADAFRRRFAVPAPAGGQPAARS